MVKTGGDKLTGMILVVVSNGLMGLVVAGFYPLPGADVWPWIIASGVIRTVYYLALGFAYEHGDLSRGTSKHIASLATALRPHQTGVGEAPEYAEHIASGDLRVACDLLGRPRLRGMFGQPHHDAQRILGSLRQESSGAHR